nr:hypothetical protein [Tanacetum cinerariifolium]
MSNDFKRVFLNEDTGCALLRNKFKEVMSTCCIENGILQDASEPSNDNTNVVNALQEPFAIQQDPGNSFTYESKSNIVDDSPKVFDPPPQPPLYSCEYCGNDAHQFEDFSDSNDDSTSIDDDSFSIDNIEYVEASPPNSEIVSLERLVVAVPLLILIILFMIRSSLIFWINSFPHADRSDFYHEEFVDELAHIISPLEYDCFCFKNEPNSRDFTMDVAEDIFPTREPRVYVHNVLPTHPTL